MPSRTSARARSPAPQKKNSNAQPKSKPQAKPGARSRGRPKGTAATLASNSTGDDLVPDHDEDDEERDNSEGEGEDDQDQTALEGKFIHSKTQIFAIVVMTSVKLAILCMDLYVVLRCVHYSLGSDQNERVIGLLSLLGVFMEYYHTFSRASKQPWQTRCCLRDNRKICILVMLAFMIHDMISVYLYVMPRGCKFHVSHKCVARRRNGSLRWYMTTPESIVPTYKVPPEFLRGALWENCTCKMILQKILGVLFEVYELLFCQAYRMAPHTPIHEDDVLQNKFWYVVMYTVFVPIFTCIYFVGLVTGGFQ
jgi:hypothetical protein